MHQLRDDMREQTEGGRALCGDVPETFGSISQTEINGMAGLIAGFGTRFELATQMHDEVDRAVIAPLVQLYAKVRRLDITIRQRISSVV